MTNDDPTPDDPEPELSWRQMIVSALAAAIGVQSSANRKRDFERGRAGPFIALGIIGTALFVNPDTPVRVVEGMSQYLDGAGIEKIGDLVGATL